MLRLIEHGIKQCYTRLHMMCKCADYVNLNLISSDLINNVYYHIIDQCQVQNGGLRLVSMQGASAGINATTDYGSQTFTQDDTSQLVTSSSVNMPINRHLAAVAAMNGHVKSEGGRGTDTPPPPCSTPPPTYEQAILGGACIARRREGK